MNYSIGGVCLKGADEMKKYFSLLILLILMISMLFSGCSLRLQGPENLMMPPRLQGDYQSLQDNFVKVVGTNTNLITPSNGELKSAFIIDDFDSDSNEDAMVFYSARSTDEMINIALFEKKGSDWTYVKTVKGVGTSVDSVKLEDLNNDGIKEVIVGWNVYSNKLLCIYEPSKDKSANYFSDIGTYQYSQFSVYDIDSDGDSEIFFVNLDSASILPSASAVAVDISKDLKSTEVISEIPLDGNISGYSRLYIGKSDGKPVFYADAYKNEHDMITEVVFWDSKNKTLFAPLFEAETQTTTSTWRNCRMPILDIDSDGEYEIPVGVEVEGSEVVSAGELLDEQLYYIRWSGLKNQKLKAEKYTLYNFSEGYCFDVPSSWVGKVTINSLDSQWYFYRWNASSSEHMGNLLLSIVSHSEGSTGIDGYKSLTHFSEKAFEYQISLSGTGFGITDDYVKKNFQMITDRTGGILE